MKNVNSDYSDMYKKTKKEYDDLLVRCRSESYDNRIQNSDNENKCMWSIHNEIIGRQRTADMLVPGTAQEISNAYNYYLQNIVPELLNNTKRVEWNCNIPRNNRELLLKPVAPQ
ncbi:hypothetical protein QE152_g32531 [Popillia japonica]|uniref:Uncharacterized protein n=1 Tax=Popillia japonica TaxID=7064 RepID=A0AAW1IYU4_POPJA